MVERKQDTLKVLSCVRMNFISVSDIQSMFNYACIESREDAQDLLRCILCIKEEREFVIIGASPENFKVSIPFSLSLLLFFETHVEKMF